MKILFCLGSMDKGGAERVAANLSNNLIKDFDIKMVLTSSTYSAYPLNDRIDVVALEQKRNNNLIIRTFKRLHTLKKIIKEYQPDLIISFLPEPTLRVLMANYFNKRKILVSVRNDPKVEYNNLFKKIIANFLFKRADGIVFQTEDARNFFSNNIQRYSKIISNPINENFIGKPYSEKRNKHIVTVGRLTEQKNHRNLIMAFKQIAEDVDSDLYFYGDGPLKADLINFCKQLNLSKRVHFEGKVDNVKEHIQASEMFVLSSNYEGMPNALMEAMALGIPCISTDCPCGGPKFLIKNKINGLLVPVNDSNALANAMTAYINNPDFASRCGKNANKICETLNPEKIYQLWYEYILTLIKK